MQNDRLVTRIIIIQELLPNEKYQDEIFEQQRTDTLAKEIWEKIANTRTPTLKISHVTTVVSEK